MTGRRALARLRALRQTRRFRRLRRTLIEGIKANPQLHANQDKRSREFIVLNINAVTATPPNAFPILPVTGGAIRREITCVEPGIRAMIARRIAMSNAAGVNARQPGMRRTVHAGAAAAQP
jgi:hypothetical protein